MRGSVVKRGRTWSYVLDVGRDPVTGRRRQRWRGGFATKAEAERALAGQVSGTGGRDSVEDSALRVDAYLDQWFEGVRPALRPSTAKSYGEIVRWYLRPRLGAVRLSELNAIQVRTMYADLSRAGSVRSGGPLAPATIAAVHRVLRKACNDAVDAGLLTRSPLVGVRSPRREPPEIQTWSATEAQTFLASVRSDRLFALWALVLATGLRRGEVAGLKWDDIDVDAQGLAVRRSRVSVGYRVHEGEPKTRSGRRTVGLDDRVVDVLNGHRRRQLEERLAWGEAWTNTGYVFTAEDGRPLHPERIKVMFGGLVAETGIRRIRFHDLRHTSATLALAAGIHPKVVSERLGHSSIAITLDLYSHVTPSLQAEAAEKLGAVLFSNV
jgi:integrase